MPVRFPERPASMRFAFIFSAVLAACSSGGGGTTLPSTPAESTQAATNVTQGGFRMNAAINTYGLPNIGAFFEWGLSATLSPSPSPSVSVESSISIGSGTMNRPGFSGDSVS